MADHNGHMVLRRMNVRGDVIAVIETYIVDVITNVNETKTRNAQHSILSQYCVSAQIFPIYPEPYSECMSSLLLWFQLPLVYVGHHSSTRQRETAVNVYLASASE